MAMQVYGSFQSKKEVINEVDRLSLKGLYSKNITIFTMQNNKDDLESKTDVNVENNDTDNTDEKSLFQKAKKILMNGTDSELGIYDQLVHSGMSNQQAKKYIEEIKSGKFLVIADDELKMGHDTVSDTDTLEEPVIPRGK